MYRVEQSKYFRDLEEKPPTNIFLEIHKFLREKESEELKNVINVYYNAEIKKDASKR